MESWFKVSADVFDSDKIKILRADTKIGDSLALMWFFLLALARKKNDGGYVYATEGVAYTPKTLAAVGGFKPKIAETALEVFQQYNMIDIEDNGYIYIVGWSEYQNAEELSKLKERERCKERELWTIKTRDIFQYSSISISICIVTAAKSIICIRLLLKSTQ